MGRPKQIKVSGIEFPSIREAAAHFGVNKGNAVRRLSSGWTPEQSFELEPKPSRQAHNRVPIHSSIGKFDSIREAAQKTGIKWATIQARLAKGWSQEQALGIHAPPPPKRSGRSVECQGEVFKSVFAFADHYGKNRVRTRKRLDMGWTPEQAVDIVAPPPRFRNHYGHARNHMWKNPTTIDGKLKIEAPVGSYLLYALQNKKNGKEYVGITTGDLKARLRGHRRQAKLGTKSKLYNAMRYWGSNNFVITLIRDDAKDFQQLEIQEIEEIEARGTIKSGYNIARGGAIGTSKPISINGQTFPSMQAAARQFGIDARVFALRVSRLGWSPEEAAGIRQRDKYRREAIRFRGKTYPSIKNFAESHNRCYKQVHYRLKHKGYTLKQALDSSKSLT